MIGYHITKIAPGLVEIHEEATAYRMDEASILEALEMVQRTRTKYANPLAFQRRLELFEHALTVARQTSQTVEELECARLEQYIVRCFADDLAREELLAAVRRYTAFALRVQELDSTLKEVLVCFDHSDPDHTEWWLHVDEPAGVIKQRVLADARAVYKKGRS